MKHGDFEINIEVDADTISVTWKRLPLPPGVVPVSRYSEFQLEFNYRDILSDTVWSMLRNMHVPKAQSNSILTLVESYIAQAPA